MPDISDIPNAGVSIRRSLTVQHLLWPWVVVGIAVSLLAHGVADCFTARPVSATGLAVIAAAIGVLAGAALF